MTNFDKNYKEWLASKGCGVKEGIEIIKEISDERIHAINGWEVREIKLQVKDENGFRVVSFVESAVLDHEQTRIYKDLKTLLRQYKSACEYCCEVNKMKSLDSAISLVNNFRCAE